MDPPLTVSVSTKVLVLVPVPVLVVSVCRLYSGRRKCRYRGPRVASVVPH